MRFAGFLKVQYGTIRRFAAVVAGAIFLSYQFREYSPNGHGVGSVNPWIMGFVGASSFLLVRPVRGRGLAIGGR